MIEFTSYIRKRMATKKNGKEFYTYIITIPSKIVREYNLDKKFNKKVKVVIHTIED